MPELKAPKPLSFLSDVSQFLAYPALRWTVPFFMLVVLGAALLTPATLDIKNDDDVIKFLPREDPRVVTFEEIGYRFHGLQMAIVGVEAKDGDIFTHKNLTLLRRYATDFLTVDGVSATTSFTEINDISEMTTKEGEEASSVSDLVPDLPPLGSEAAKDPKFAELLESVKARSLSLDHVAGFLVSPDASSAAIYVQIAPDANVKETADALITMMSRIQDEVGADVDLFYGGSPFIGAYSADQTRADMLKLSPWVFVIVLLIITITAKSILAAFISLFSVVLSIIFVMGGLSLLGIPMTLVSTSLPALLIALGSAYSIHLLNSNLMNLDKGLSRKEAAIAGLRQTGPAVIISAVTTSAGFISFLGMDVAPMREFGLYMSISTLVILIVTFWVVSSACILLPLKLRKEGRAPRWAISLMQNSSRIVQNRPLLSAIFLIVLISSSIYFITKVETHNDNNSLFSPDSPPVVADNFMVERFGGSNFIQIEIDGKINNSLVLRQVERMTALANAHPRVAGVQSASDVIVIVGGTMGDGKHIPSSSALTSTLAALAFAEDSSVAMLADATWEHTLMQIRVRGANLAEGAAIADELALAFEPLGQSRIAVARDKLNARARAVELEEIAQHLQWILQKYEKTLDADEIKKILQSEDVKISQDELQLALKLNLFDEDDAILYLDTELANLDEMTAKVAKAIESGAYSRQWFESMIRPFLLAEELEDEVGLAAGITYVHNAIEDVGTTKIRKLRTENIFNAINVTKPSEKFAQLVEGAVWSLGEDLVFLPESEFPELAPHATDTQSMKVIPSGYPVIYTAMNNSVIHNQFVSLIGSAILVFIILLLFTRRLSMAVFGLIPAALTIIFIFAIMGLFRISMDVGTSMIAAISLGVGIDYACHLMWRFGRPKPEEALAASNHMLESSGWGIVINALEIGLGLSVLYFGSLTPMCNFGVLTGAAMLINALCSLLILPGLFQFAAKRWYKHDEASAAS
ncbi:MAG: efflux RND transporter permease subunit [Bradymonadia bacterium]|jgi:predicted RND superfamily exporter protein